MKKKILFVYHEMIIGGSTTSLLSILNLIDYSRYEVDLLLYYNQGPLFCQIPKQVNILPQASIYPPSAKLIKIVRSALKGDIQRAVYYNLLYEKKLGFNMQAMAYARVTNSRLIDNEYDVAIGFLEGWPNDYVALKVKAKKKIGWVHPDVKNSYIMPEIDDRTYRKLDNIVLVSQKSMENFKEMFPKFKNKAVYLENIHLQETVRALSNEFVPDINIEKSKINLVTVCRIDFSSKGLDRGINAFIKLKQEKLLGDFCWYIIGGGKDSNKLERLICESNLSQYINFIGERINPFPYVKLMDLFFLPSRYEGKPMAVTEALMLGIPALVTAYASAYEQIRNGLDGLIIENDDYSVYDGLKKIIGKKDLINQMKKNASFYDYSNINIIDDYYKIIE